MRSRLITLNSIAGEVATSLMQGFEHLVEDIAHDKKIEGVSSFRVAALVNDGLRDFEKAVSEKKLTLYIEVHRNDPEVDHTIVPFGTYVTLTEEFPFYNMDEDVENPPEVGDHCVVVGTEKGDEGGTVYYLVDQRCPRYVWVSELDGFKVDYR